jgi:flagellar protein FliS
MQPQAKLHETYLKTRIQTATPGQRVVMLFDGALRFLAEAKSALAERDIPRQSSRISRAQMILSELMSSLNLKAGGELSNNLLTIYSRCFDLLSHASVRDDPAAVDEVCGILTGLRDAFSEAEMQVSWNLSHSSVPPDGYVS